MDAAKPLTPRETEILGLLAEGLSNDEIAQRLTISPNTVKVHVRNIFEKMGVQSRTEATMEAVRRGWIEVPGLGSEIEPPAWPPLQVDFGPGQALGVLLAVLVALAVGLWPQKQWHSSAPLLAPFSSDRAAPRTVLLPRMTVPRWTQRAALPTPRSLAATAFVNGRLYVAGGENAGGDLATLEVYDPTLDVWQGFAPLPQAMRGAAATALGDRLLVAGGCAGNEVLAQAYVYQPAEDSWQSIAPLPAPRCGGSLVNWQGVPYFLGGWDGVNVMADVFMYSESEDRWQAGPALPAPRAFAAAVALPTGIWLLGGSDGSEQQATMWHLAAAGGRWQPQPDLPAARRGLAAAADGTSIYAFGGGDDQDSPLHDRFDLATLTWSTIDWPYQGPWRHGSAVMIGPNLHLIGGWGGDYLQIHEAYQAAFFQFLPLGAQNAR